MKEVKIKKRDGSIENFDLGKIAKAIELAMAETLIGVDDTVIEEILQTIEMEVRESTLTHTVEEIQDWVESLLAVNGRFDVSKKYILYREERSRLRNLRGDGKGEFDFLSDTFLKDYKHRQDPFPNELGRFVYYRTYSRPKPEENRREKWWETVARVVDFNVGLEREAMKSQGIPLTVSHELRLRKRAEEMYDLIYNLKLFSSGRTLWVGGTPASKEYPLSNFNCSFITIDHISKFSEMFFVLMLGTGVGLSVERKYVDKLPKVNSSIEIIQKNYKPVPKAQRNEHTELKVVGKGMFEMVIGDSKYGWSRAIELYLEIITSRQYDDTTHILINYDHVRPAGEILKTFGGRASGHEALLTMFDKIHSIVQKEQDTKWRKLKPIDALDIATIIAENVVSGGVRRSALIVLSDHDDEEVKKAKSNLYYQDENGSWQANTKLLHRSLSNNTIPHYSRPSREDLKEQFRIMRYSGEPAMANMEEMRRRREDVQGGNPCFEILLRDGGVCNLTEVNMMGFVNEDGSYDREGMINAQAISATMGYRMATIELELHRWNQVNEEDRLVGCSLTGMMDFVNATGISKVELIELLKDLRETAHKAANGLADFLGLNRPKLHTAIKPSGTISQLPTVSSGMHYSHSPYYIRRVRVTAHDPMAIASAEIGIPWYPEVGQTVENHKTKVFEFPVKAPKGKTKYDVSAIEQLELYKTVMENYVDHNASNTIHVRDDEWEEVEQWVYDNWSSMVGVTFLSLDDSFYQLMPYESITEEEYNERLFKMPKFNPSILRQYENFEEEFDILDADCDSGACPVR